MTDDTADMVMALILSVLRRVPEGMAVMQEGNWAGWAPTAFMGGRRRRPAAGHPRAWAGSDRPWPGAREAFGMQVHYHNRRRLHPDTEAEFEATYWESLDQMIARMDVISVNCPHTPSTFHLMNARRLKLMKKDAVIVNTSRGEVIDENALTRMPAQRRDRGGGPRRVREGPRGEPPPARAAERGSAAAYGLGHAARAAPRWARRSSSTSRPSPTGTGRRTWSCPRCSRGVRISSRPLREALVAAWCLRREYLKPEEEGRLFLGMSLSRRIASGGRGGTGRARAGRGSADFERSVRP